MLGDWRSWAAGGVVIGWWRSTFRMELVERVGILLEFENNDRRRQFFRPLLELSLGVFLLSQGPLFIVAMPLKHCRTPLKQLSQNAISRHFLQFC